MAGGGSFDLNPVQAALSNPALQIQVCQLRRRARARSTPLPRTSCASASTSARRASYPSRLSPTSATSRMTTLRTISGGRASTSSSGRSTSQGPYAVQTDERLVVLAYTPNGSPIALFDGFAQIPQVAVGAGQQAVTFAAVSVEVRLLGYSDHGSNPARCRQRRATRPARATSSFSYRCRFNPADTSIGGMGGYLGNCVASGLYTENEDLGQYPVFIDPQSKEDDSGFTSDWYVSDAVTYLLARMQLDLQWAKWVTFPTLSSVVQLLQSQEPPNGSQILNSGDAQGSDIPIRDYDATNKHYVDVIVELLNYCGFVVEFKTTTQGDGTPTTALVVARRDNLSAVQPKPVYHAPAGVTSLDPSANNVTHYTLARDLNQVANQVTVETALQQYEATFYLAPLFTPSSSDISSPGTYKLSTLTTATATTRRKYRWYGVDETGDGFYNMNTSTWTTDYPCDFSSLFPADSNGNATWVERYRKPSRTLISTDSAGRPLKAVLEVAFGVDSSTPGPVSTLGGSNTWFALPDGWKLLDDRLGIEIIAEDVEAWGCGNDKVNHGVIQGISWVANASAGGNITVNSSSVEPSFALRLTTVIEGDQRIDVAAYARSASPTQYPRERAIDAHEHFQYCQVVPNSLYYTADGGDGTHNYVARDDTDAATTHAQQIRSAHEMPTLAGSMTIPFLTDYYALGDRINMIQGRNANLQTNVGGDQGEAPSYPWIVARSFVFEPRQETVLQLSDRRAEVRNAW